MKLILGRFILFLALVITSISVCFPSDSDCIDEHTKSEKIVEKTSQSSDSADANNQESHHCICSLSCHNLIVFNFDETSSDVFTIKQSNNHLYEIAFYPQVTLTLEKPPTV